MTNNLNENMLCQRYLDIIYRDTKRHFSDNKHKYKDASDTYGEILYESANKLISKIHFSENDVFVDLGSGLGKFVIQVFLNSIVKEARGIELISELHQQALTAAEKVKRDIPNVFLGERKLDFTLGDFLNTSFDSATVVFICAPCFSQKTLFTLGKRINEIPSIHTVLSLRPLSSLYHLSFKEAVRVECSWDTALCYIYKTG